MRESIRGRSRYPFSQTCVRRWRAGRRKQGSSKQQSLHQLKHAVGSEEVLGHSMLVPKPEIHSSAINMSRSKLIGLSFGLSNLLGAESNFVTQLWCREPHATTHGFSASASAVYTLLSFLFTFSRHEKRSEEQLSEH